MSAPVDLREQQTDQPVSPARTPGPRHHVDSRPRPAAATSWRGIALTIAVTALVASACLPFTLVMVGPGALRPLLVAGMLSIAVSFTVRLIGLGPISGLVASAAAWSMWAGVIYLPETLMYGFLPTLQSAAAGVELWTQGAEQIRTRPSPVFAEPPILFIVTTGVWAVAYTVEAFVFRLATPLGGIAMALVLWTVPLTMSTMVPSLWLMVGPLLLSASTVLLTATGMNRSWGPLINASARRGVGITMISGAMAALAVITAVSFAGLVPGFGEPPWVELRGSGGPTITTNPIVSVRPSLVANDDVEIMQVDTPRPVYMRLTALDQFENEEWTSAGISGGSVSGDLPLETDLPYAHELGVTVQASSLDEAILMPAPYHPTSIDSEVDPDAGVADRVQFDPDGATFTLSDPGVDAGAAYSVTAAIPEPPIEELRTASFEDVDPALTALPDDIPEEVTGLAREIVDGADAQTPVDQALAIQQELQSWEYSLSPPQGHGRNAMVAFIEQRVGYCEQYAATMAVMLRSLGIPSRVAVGYTPGEQQADGTFRVTNANAHAWVEVLFPEHGWVYFEPTPRSDGNIMVPSVTSMAPAQTQAAPEAAEDLELEGGDQGMSAEDEQQLLEERAAESQGQLEEQFAGPEDGIGSVGGAAQPATVWGWLITLGIIVLALGAWVVTGNRRYAGKEGPELVLALAEQTEELAGGLGRDRKIDETDTEFLRRVSGADPAGYRLGGAVSQARFARDVTEDVTRHARRDAGRIQSLMTESQSAPRRWLAPHLGRAKRLLRRLRR